MVGVGCHRDWGKVGNVRKAVVAPGHFWNIVISLRYTSHSQEHVAENVRLWGCADFERGGPLSGEIEDCGQ